MKRIFNSLEITSFNQYSLLIKFYKLEPYLKQLLLNNSGVANPYHNLQHTFNVINLCSEIATDEDLSYDQKRTLFIAAMFHDFDYTTIFQWTRIFPTIEEREEINVESAISAFKKSSVEDDETTNEIISLIRSTNSFKILDNPTKLEMILYDSDRLCWTNPTWLQDVINLYGLEWNSISTKNGLYSALKQEYDFIQNLKLYTKRGKEIYTTEYSFILTEINYLMEIIK